MTEESKQETPEEETTGAAEPKREPLYAKGELTAMFPLAIDRRTERGMTMKVVMDVEGVMAMYLEESIPQAANAYRRRGTPDKRQELEDRLTAYCELWLAQRCGLTTLPTRVLPEGWAIVDGDGEPAEVPAGSGVRCATCGELKSPATVRLVDGVVQCWDCVPPEPCNDCNLTDACPGHTRCEAVRLWRATPDTE